ncbi:uncharacterized protein CC84DRAFT_393056 [Paraphaeosphaeria sporulosa]|uniref:AMP-activated protein kinase glycogen-binding domain-containing protein n=1 Tax=Paraphaeosphaeria sporulosa TaxID=1460663 RepID=A0A177BX86_9PLEO|nr:uncharacterized protein CC84DRAFT_393056 [Paraphaeosphaeria sporulosa]OAF99311.1 hypothetical protein CC84DRAFT_393056 [Paraphaeosphaeria sporulosa]
MDKDVQFTGRATITIHLADAPPVVVWTSLNSWQTPLEMIADSPPSNTYRIQVYNVPEQSFQYKVRAGNRWVLDDNMPIAQDQAGNHNNVGYTEHIPRAGTPDSSTMANGDLAQNTERRTGRQDGLIPLVSIPPLDSGHAQTDMRPKTSETMVSQGEPDVEEDLLYDVDPGYNADQEAPLLRHETFKEEPDSSLHTQDDVRPGPRPRSPPMATIQEETMTADDGGTDSQPGTPSSLEQAREYQRLLIEAMPTSIANGFTRAFVLFPVRPPDEASELDNAPLMRHETMTTPDGRHRIEQQDELSHAPLMRHETVLRDDDDDSQIQDISEFEQAPLMRHETNLASSEPDELGHAPLMRHETNVASSAIDEPAGFQHTPSMRFEAALSPEVTYGDSAERRVSYSTTLVDEENGADDELSHAPLMRHETVPGHFDDSEQSSLYSERMMFLMETSNPPTLVGPQRSSSVYSHGLNELDRALLPHEMPDWWVSDESAFDDWLDPRAAPDYHANIAYYEASDGSSEGDDDESVAELDRAPTMSHENGSETTGELNRAPTLPHEVGNSTSSSSSRTDELDSAPMLPHEAQYASDTQAFPKSDGASSERRRRGVSDNDAASQRSKTRRIISGEEDLLSTSKTNSFTSERLREAFKSRIFGANRQSTRDAENDFDFGGTPLLTHERTYPLPDRASNDSLGSIWKQHNIEIPDIPSFARRLSSGVYRFQRSNLPHRMPRSDAEDLDLRDPSLEIFPMDREQVFGRVRDISHRLAEDEVRSPLGELDSPAVVSHASSSVNLVSIRSSSTMSLHSIREDASENEDESQLPSPVLMLASRVPKTSPINIPRVSTRQHAGIIHEEMEISEATNFKRHGKVFDTVVLPPEPPQANVALPPKPATISFNEPTDANAIGKAKHRCRTPYPDVGTSDEEDGGHITRKLCAHFRECFPSRRASIVSVGILVAGAAWLWKRWT